MQVHKTENRLRLRFREATRAAILEAAEGVFARQGSQAARMEDIAHAAGIAVGTVYNYFADRQALVLALFDSRRSELLEHIDAALDSSKMLPFEQRLEAFLAASFGHFEAHRTLFTLALEDELQAMRCGPKRSWVQKIRSRLEVLIDDGVAEGTLEARDAALFPAMILGLARGTVMQAISEREPLSALVGPVVRLFLHGARPQ